MSSAVAIRRRRDTNHIARPAAMREISAVSFGEAAPGQPRPIAVWYPPESSDGLQFRYR